MILENDTARLITLNCSGYAPLNLVPGRNDVDEKHWEALVKAKGQKGDKRKGTKDGFVACLLKTRELIVGGIEVDEEDLRVPGNAGDAINAVRLCEDEAQLEAWSEHEERKTVLAAIDEQLSELQKGSEDPDEI